MSDKIAPALDAEDWAVELAGTDDFPGPVQPAGTFSGAVFIRDGRIAITYDSGEAAQFVADDERHRLAALALYGQPFGFTREDVERLRTAAKVVEIETWEGESGQLLELADRIESLLPPKKT